MKNIDEIIRPILSKLPEGYSRAAARLQADADYKLMWQMWFVGRERIIRKLKMTGDSSWANVLVGYDEATRMIERLAGNTKTETQKENEVLAIKEMEGLV